MSSAGGAGGAGNSNVDISRYQQLDSGPAAQGAAEATAPVSTEVEAQQQAATNNADPVPTSTYENAAPKSTLIGGGVRDNLDPSQAERDQAKGKMQDVKLKAEVKMRPSMRKAKS